MSVAGPNSFLASGTARPGWPSQAQTSDTFSRRASTPAWIVARSRSAGRSRAISGASRANASWSSSTVGPPPLRARRWAAGAPRFPQGGAARRPSPSRRSGRPSGTPMPRRSRRTAPPGVTLPRTGPRGSGPGRRRHAPPRDLDHVRSWLDGINPQSVGNQLLGQFAVPDPTSTTRASAPRPASSTAALTISRG